MTAKSVDIDKSLLDKQNRPKSVLQMKRQLEGSIIGYGTLVGISEQYVVVSRTTATCTGDVRCKCDAAPDEHTRPCGYTVDIKHNPPVPIIISIFDVGNGKSLVCPRCKGIDYEVVMERRIARLIQLEDTENHSADVFQNVIVYDEMVENLTFGELVQVEGDIHVERRPGSGKNTKMDNILHAKSIKNLQKKEVIITDDDIKRFYRWKQLSEKEYTKEVDLVNQYKQWSKEYECEECARYAKRIIPMTFVDRLVAAFAPNVIGYPEAKLGLLRSIVGGRNRGEGAMAGKIHTFLVGDPGTAKSKLAGEAMRIKPNCRHISAPHATTKAITAIVDKESQVLRLGSIPLSDMVAIDEATTFPIEDQSRLLGILQEQRFPKDAYSKHYDIPALTTVVATANPMNNTWLNDSEISDNEIKMLKTLRDRFTQVYSFRDDNDTEEKRMIFAEKLSAILKRPLPNYLHLSKFLIYVSNAIEPEIAPEAERTLTKFWAQENGHAVMKNRSHHHMFKIAEAQAKLQLNNQVNDEIVNQVQKSIQAMVLQYGSMINTVTPVSQVTYNKFLEILQRTKTGMTVNELCRITCSQDAAIATYLGKNWSIQNNWKLRTVIDMLKNHGETRTIGNKPMVFQWVGAAASDASDASDELKELDDRQILPEFKNTADESLIPAQKKSTSETSDTSDKGRIMQTCSRCGETGDGFYMRIHQCETDY